MTPQVNKDKVPSRAIEADGEQESSGQNSPISKSDKLANIINSVNKKTAPNSSQFKRLSTGLFGSNSLADVDEELFVPQDLKPLSVKINGKDTNGKTAPSEPEPGPEEGLIHKQLSANLEDVEMESVGETSIQKPSQSKKRRDPNRSIYSGPEDSERDQAEKLPVSNLPKRAKQNSAVKKPVPSKNRKIQTVAPKATNTAATGEATEEPVKPGRGGPSRKKPTPSEITEEKRPQRGKGNGEGSNLAGLKEAEANLSNGIEDILEGPSDTEIQAAAPSQKSTKKVHKKSKGSNGKKVLPVPAKATPAGSAGRKDNTANRAGETNEESESSPGPTTAHRSVDLELVDKIQDKLERVGHKYDSTTKTYSEEKTNSDVKSTLGKSLQKQLIRLRNFYRKMKTFRENDDIKTFKETHDDCEELITAIDSKVSKITLETLRLDRKDITDDERLRILTDLYFNIFPRFTVALKSAIEAYADVNDGQLSIPIFHELVGLLTLMLELAEAAKSQREQPRAPSNQSYIISQPTQHAIPLLKQLRKKWLLDSNAIQYAEKKAEREENAAALRKIRQEREAEEQRFAEERLRLETAAQRKAQDAIIAQKRARLHTSDSEISSQGWQTQSQVPGPLRRRAPSMARLNYLRAQREYAEEQLRISKDRLDDAQRILNELSDEEDEQVYARKRQYFQNEAAPFEYRFQDARRKVKEFRQREEHEIRLFEAQEAGSEDAEEDEDQDVERVRMFPGNNKSQHDQSRPWSDEDKLLFIDTLKAFSTNPNMYEALAKKFDRSLDEIFEQVKDFKEAMDILHEQGQFTENCFNWIEDIKIRR